MGGLVSPGTQVTVTDQSFFIPVSAPTVPLIFIATQAGKYQPQYDGSTAQVPADGTNEHSVVRTITSIGQSVATYGIPYFWNDGVQPTPNQYYGDCRNETGLFALNQFLGIGSSAYVVRANIDLTDSVAPFVGAGIPQYDSTTLQYVGLGNGTIGSITVPGSGAQTQNVPESWTIVSLGLLGSDTVPSFTVTGTMSGMVGLAKVDIPFTSNAINFTISSASSNPIQFVAGDYFEFSTAYASNSGYSYVYGITVGSTATSAETYTITITGNTYNVTGVSPTGITMTQPLATPLPIGTKYNEPAGRISFTVNVDSGANASGDTFTIATGVVQPNPPLGANDAQKRQAIITALQAEINSNQDVRAEIFEYNLILCPGFSEVVDELIALSDDIGNEAFVIADTPCNYNPELLVSKWSPDNSKHFHREVAAYYYPWAISSNLDGQDVAVAPSGVALRTYAYSDNQQNVWWAPAGFRRGVVDSISNVGYVSGNLGLPTTFNTVNLNQGQRDNLYNYFANINPIVSFPNQGYVVWGQKTSYSSASALDRVNVVRLLCYIRRAIRKGSQPFIFEPNDQITRDDFKSMVDGFLGDIMLQRGLYDYVTLCNATNNTPTQIDRNEMWMDIGLKPMKAVEFIYVPIRVLTTGAAMGTA